MVAERRKSSIILGDTLRMVTSFWMMIRVYLIRINEGWDYPPRMGTFGIVSPRTCGDCSMMDTLWMALQSGKIKGVDDMTVDQRVVLARIQNEPASITPPTNS